MLALLLSPDHSEHEQQKHTKKNMVLKNFKGRDMLNLRREIA